MAMKVHETAVGVAIGMHRRGNGTPSGKLSPHVVSHCRDDAMARASKAPPDGTLIYIQPYIHIWYPIKLWMAKVDVVLSNLFVSNAA